MKDRCLTDEEMSAYVDGVVDADLRRRIEKHLAECPVCLHHVAELKELVDPQVAYAAVPTAEALSKAEDIISQYAQASSGFDITVALRQGLCKILETTGDLLTPRGLAPVAVRGEGRVEPAPRVAKSLSGYLVTLELPTKKGRLQPKVMLALEASSDKPDGIRIKLYSPGACETKYTEAGRAAFQPVGSGDYTIDIEDIGTIELEITG